MHLTTALALAALLGECVVGQNSCPVQSTCGACLNVKDASSITLCGWCRNSNITSEGFCADRTVASINQCTGSFTSDGSNHDLLVLDAADCSISTSQNTLIAAVAGSVGGVIFAVVIIYIYYRKKKQKQERLASFRRRELEMHRSRKLKLDKEMGMQAGAASSNQRQLAMSDSARQMHPSNSFSQMKKSNSSNQMQKSNSSNQMQKSNSANQMGSYGVDIKAPDYSDPPPPFEAEISKTTRRRFKCMSKGGLRVRESPNSESAKVGGIKFEVVITALSVKGNWVQVSANGWAMITSDDGTKVFLKELGEGDQDGEPEVVG